MFLALFTFSEPGVGVPVICGSLKEREIGIIPKEYYNKNLQVSMPGRILELKRNWITSMAKSITYMNNLIFISEANLFFSTDNFF